MELNAFLNGPFLVFDVESMGLYGDPFAVGFVVIDATGKELDFGTFVCPTSNLHCTKENREWLAKHVFPHIPNYTHTTPDGIAEAFWGVWMQWKERGASMVSDCGFPVETNFLRRCVGFGDLAQTREFLGPYPLYDVSTARLMAGLHPVATNYRLDGEKPAHNPLCDARQSARLFLEAINLVRAKQGKANESLG